MLTYLVAVLALVVCLPGRGARANDAGGGAAGVGANVVLSTTSSTATLNNGVIEAIIDKATGKVSSMKLNGVQTVDPAKPIYYSMDGGSTYEQPSGCVYSTVINTPDHVEVSCKRTWTNTPHAFDIELHYVLRRSDTGLYAFAILDHPATYPATSVGEWRIVWFFPKTSTTFAFERAYVDSLRNWEMPSYYDYQHALATGIAEIVKLTTGVCAGLYDGKYTYSARYFDVGTWGHASNLSKKGVWFVLGGHDYFNDGPTKQDLTTSESYNLMHFGRNHYGGSSTSVAAGESWRKLYGPFLLYCNSTTATSNAGDALWTDAKAQVAAETAAWPYSWLTTADHPAASARGTVTGRFLVNDPLKPALTGANAYVGLAAPEDSDGNWQFQSKKYQYWTRADAAGNFAIPAVRPGSYTLYAFTDGAVGEFSKPLITVSAGGTNAQGNLTWNVPRSGASLAWEIGTPDRTAKEFRHGQDYFTPYLWDVTPTEFPNPLVFNVGTDDPATAWNYVHGSYPIAPGSGTRGQWNWKINFNLAAVPPSGNAKFIVAIASANYARLYLTINDDSTSFARISPQVSGGNALLRQGIHAKYSVVNISIPVDKLRVGANTFTLSQNVTDTSSHVMYDYLALELPAFPPLPPSSGRSIIWKGGTTAAANTWDSGTTSSFLNGASASAFGTGDDVTFNDTGSNATSVTLTGALEPEKVTVNNTTKNQTFSGTGSLIGQMTLVKSGTGKLTLSSANSFAGPTILNAGTLTFGTDAANGNALGTSDVSLKGGTLTMFYSSTSATVSAPWDLSVPGGATATFRPAWRCTITGKLTGSGTLNFVLPSSSVRADITGDWSGFAGRINVSASSGVADFRMSRDYSWPGLPDGALDLGAGITAYYEGNLNQGNGTFVSFGEISGAASATLKGGNIGGRQVTYRVGGRDTDATFDGVISEQANGFTNLVKTGVGVWTLGGQNIYQGVTTVEQGTLRITGSIANSSSVEVQPTATLQVNGSLTTGAVYIADNGILLGPGAISATLVNDGFASANGGAFTFTGNVTNNGVMRLSGNAALVCSGTFTNNGVLDLIDSNTALPASFVSNGLVLRARAAASLIWTGSTSAVWDSLTSANWLNGAAPDVFRAGDAVTFNDTSAVTEVELATVLAPSAVTVNTARVFSLGGTGAIGGAASLTKTGAGLLTIASTQPLSGPVLVSGGTLQLGLDGAFPNTPSFTVGAGATLDVSGVTGGFGVNAGQTFGGSGSVIGPVIVNGTLSPGSGAGTLNVTGALTIGASALLNFELGTASDRVAITGDLALGGKLSVSPGAGFGAGAYPLFTYTGTLSNAGALAFQNLPAGYDYALDTATPGQVRLIVSATTLTQFQRWAIQFFGDYTTPNTAPGADPDGDGQTNADEFAAGTNPNSATSVALLAWRGNGSSNLWDQSVTSTFWNGARLCAFVNTNPVLFDDTGAANGTVNLSGTLAPASVVVNAAGAYTFAGTGALSGAASVVKSGAGLLTINAANTFTGGVTIQSGTVRIGNAAALGTGVVTLRGGTLDTQALAPTNAIAVAAESTITGGSGGGLQGIKAVTGSDRLNVVSTSVFDFEGSLSGFSGRLAMSGAGSFRFDGSAGSSAAEFDLGTRPLSARSGIAFALGALSGVAGSVLTGASGSGNTTAVTYTIGGNGASTTFAGVIANGGGVTSVTKTGAGTLTLTGANTFTGATTISAGRFALSGSLTSAITASSGTLAPQGAPATSGNLNVQSGGRFEARVGAASDTLSVGGSVTLSGALDVIPSPILAPGSTFTIISKTSAGAVSGAFSGKPENSIFSSGGYNFRIRYTGGDGNDVVLTLVTTATENWRYQFFGNIANTGAGSDTFDANGDGENNLLEFATAQNPNAGTVAATTITRNGGNLEFTYNRPTAADGIVYAVEWRDDLSSGAWSAAGVTQQTVTDNGTVQTIRATVPAGASAHRFLHLKVTAP